jgi:hypothetical protein
VDLGMRIAEFQFSFRFVYYLFQTEIRNPKSEILFLWSADKRKGLTTSLGHFA